MEPGSKTSVVTLCGLPLEIELEWPFHPAQAGLDWRVMHARATVPEADGLRADCAINMTITVAEALPSLAPEHTGAAAINAIRKAADHGELEFLKSGKRQPVLISSRQWSLRRRVFTFSEASDEQVREFLQCKVFWLGGAEAIAIAIADPTDAQYLANRTTAELLQAARQLAGEGWITLAGEAARATEKLLQASAQFAERKSKALAKGQGATRTAAG